MKSGIVWTKKTTDDFIELGMLTDEETYLLKTRIKLVPVSVQADYLGCSRSTVQRMLRVIRKKYDAVQKEYPEKFMPRRYSEKETWMDNN